MKKAIIILLAFLFPPTFQCSRILDNLTDWVVSDSDEVAMGTSFYKQILADPAQYPMMDTTGNANNKKIVTYIDSIGRYIASRQTARPENAYLKYKFSVIDDTVVNAFAIPGGYVFIHRGLIKSARDEAEIAGVIAHELAHITQKHGVQTLVKAQGIEYVEKLILGDDPGLLVDIMNSLVFLKFSRENEFEADSCSVEFCITGGYNPNGMKTFLELLGQNSGWSFEPLSTHPDSDKRVEAVTGIIAKKPVSLINSLPIPTKKVVAHGMRQ